MNILMTFAKFTIPPQSFVLYDILSTMLETFSYHAFISDTFGLYYSQPCLNPMKQACALQEYYISNVFQKLMRRKKIYELKINNNKAKTWIVQMREQWTLMMCSSRDNSDKRRQRC